MSALLLDVFQVSEQWWVKVLFGIGMGTMVLLTLIGKPLDDPHSFGSRLLIVVLPLALWPILFDMGYDEIRKAVSVCPGTSRVI